MSRCFPYPPPGYVKNGIRDEALIESIKLQREEEKAKKERKKDKKREKKEKEKSHASGDIESKKHRHKKRQRDDKSKENLKGVENKKGKGNEIENYEKSSLTEEHGQPIGSENSTDSSLKSNKRQKQSSPADGRQNPGSIIRIRLPTQRQKDPEVLPSKDDRPVFGRISDANVKRMQEPACTPGRELRNDPSSTSQNSAPEVTLRLNKEASKHSARASEKFVRKAEAPKHSALASDNTAPEVSLRLNKEAPKHSTSVSGMLVHKAEAPKHSASASDKLVHKTEAPKHSACVSGKFEHKADTSLSSKLCSRCSPSLALHFKKLVEDWVPPPVQSECTDLDDQDWLFQTKRNPSRGAIESELGNVSLTQGSLTPWPCASCLPQADIYALPYTVPF